MRSLVLAILVVLSLPIHAAQFTATITKADVVLKQPRRLELRGEQPRTLVVHSLGGTAARPVMTASVLDGTCLTDTLDARACDQLLVDFRSGKIEYRSFKRERGLRTFVTNLDAVWAAPQRLDIRTRPARRSNVSVAIASVPVGKSERITYTAKVEGRTFTHTVDASLRAPISLAPLALAFHDALARPDIAVRSQTVDTGTSTPNPGSDDNRACDICDFCRNKPGGNKLLDCIDDPGLNGGGGGGTAVPAPPGSCTISTERVLDMLASVLEFESGVKDLCKGSFSTMFFGIYTTAFSGEAAAFKKYRGTLALSDTKSRGCAKCFLDVAKRFDGATGPIAVIRGQLSPKCITTLTDLTDPANAAEHNVVSSIANAYRDDLARCKRGCDNTAATHRAYCDCLTGYVAWEPTGPGAGTSGCPK
ncbi:MAG TPA: hypothetical protein VF608_00070 [Thermoanaerobaculia bacterium]